MIFIICGLAGTGSDVPWGLVKLKHEIGNENCDAWYRFGTVEYKSFPCTIGNIRTGEEKTIKYEDCDAFQYDFNKDHKNFCDDCQKAGDSIIGLLAVALVATLIAMPIVWLRVGDIDKGLEGQGCTGKRLIVTFIISLAVVMVISACAVWSSNCQDRLEDYMKWRVDNDILVDKGESMVGAGYALATVAWILLIVAASNELCTPPKPSEVAGGHQANAAPVDGVVTATPLHAPATEMAYPQPVQVVHQAQPVYVAQPAPAPKI
eukprot:CAMPEP_0197515370 /NCGR_PEP_ID=MMETSP1318-20131121/530_1 /TAXON_ID=552666 /ORGANISM="Partenskyella glossopodia, Strain RCC365" /LENGTH=262 /DNA_ID=CAMNT_0043063729 /DNA_START=262 /DNA_END=1050 /DNA_ORIENTATION=-